MKSNNQLQFTKSNNGLLAGNMILVGDTPVKFDKKFMANYMGVPNISDQNMAKVLTKAYAEGLNPLTDFHVVSFKGKCDLMEKVENKLKRAKENTDYLGIEQGVYVVNKQGILEKRNNEIKLEGEELVGAWATVKTKSTGDITKSVNFSEYNTDMSTWKSKPVTMIVKVARGQALDLAFPNLFNGMYTQEEVETNPEATTYRATVQEEHTQNLNDFTEADFTEADFTEVEQPQQPQHEQNKQQIEDLFNENQTPVNEFEGQTGLF